MKRIIVIVLAIIALLAMTIPAMAALPASVTIGTSGSSIPIIKVLSMTPDMVDAATDGINIDPEPAKPLADGTFSPIGSLSVNSDGWKRVNFYVEISPGTDDYDNINFVTIDVYYPNSAAIIAAGYPEFADAAIFGNRGDALKFEIDAAKDPTLGWVISSTQYSFNATNTYPDGTVGVPPASTVRQLLASPTASDWVDMNANGIKDAGDIGWVSFLNTYGTRLVYGSGITPEDAIAEYNDNQALVLEISAWLWFHQPGLTYTTTANAYIDSGKSAPVVNWFNYTKMVSMYLDFTAVNYPNVTAGGTSMAVGDFSLSTAGLTIWDNGNASAQVSVNSTRMVYNGDPAFYDNPNKSIGNFDARLYYRSIATGLNVQVGYITYLADVAPTVITNDGTGTHQQVGPTGAVLLQACRPAKIELSVEPAIPLTGTLAQGTYTGTITIGVAAYGGTQPVVP